MGTTRYRFTSDGTAPGVSPSFQTYTHSQGTRRKLLTTDSSALTDSAYTPDTSDDSNAGDSLHIQFVSDPLAAGIAFDSGNDLHVCIQGLEPNANCNQRIQIYVSVVNSSGVEQATLRSKVNFPTELATALTARFLDTTLDGTYTTAANDRLVVEIGTQGTPAGGGGVQGHNATLRWGNNGAGGDLAAADGETGTTLNPWLDIVDTPAGTNYDETGRQVSIAATVSQTEVLTFGELGRLVSAAATVGASNYATGYVRMVPTTGWPTTPDDAAYDVTQTLEIIALYRLPDWNPTSGDVPRLVNKRDTSGNDRSFSFLLTTAIAGRLAFNWSTDGTPGGSPPSLNSSASVPAADGEHLWVRMLFDPDNGSGQHQVTFWTSQDPIGTDPASVSWTQLGGVVTGTGTTSIFNSGQPLSVGSFVGNSSVNSQAYYVKVIVDGATVAEPDWRSRRQWTSGAQLLDDYGRTWTVNSPAVWNRPDGQNHYEVGRLVTAAATIDETDTYTPAGGQQYDETGRQVVIAATIDRTDALTLGETARQVTIAATVTGTDGLTITEADRPITAAATITATDSLTWTEPTQVTIAATVTGTDSLTWTEATEVVVAATATATDSLTWTEAVEVAATATITVADQAALVEAGEVTVAATVDETDVYTPASGQQYDETLRQVTGTVTVTATDMLPTVLYPDGDIAASGWDTAPTPSQSLYAQLDEVGADVDTDYIYASA